MKIYKGTPYDVGYEIGFDLKDRFHDNINQYINTIDQTFGLDFNQLDQYAMDWFKELPEAYQKELEGIADGAKLKTSMMAKWYYSDYCMTGGCTSFITKVNDELWVGRNNDYIESNLWGHVTKIHIEGKIPVMLFGFEGNSFSGTGYNQQKLWVHYNYLPDKKPQNELITPSFVFVRMALEECETIDEVETLLQNTVRDTGMNLFVVDGKTDEYAVFECTCSTYQKRIVEEDFIAGANHYNVIDKGKQSESSIKRQRRVEILLKEGIIDPLEDSIRILSDSIVEQTDAEFGTVYANVVCPSKDLVYYTTAGFPAASCGDWEQITW